MRDIRDLISEFTEKLTAFVETQVVDRARSAVDSALSRGGTRLKPGRRKGPIQLCPVPGCKNRAAPVFGMVCAKHKDLPKAKIKTYREARKSARAKGKKAA